MTRLHKSSLIAAWVMLSASSGFAQSQYQELTSDMWVYAGSAVVVRTATVTFASPGMLFVNADGTFAPLTNDSAANMFIRIDGQQASNDSIIDWRATTDNQAHAFNAIGARWVGTGTHTVELVAWAITGAFSVSAGANLSAMKSHATTVVEQVQPSDTAYFDFTTENDYHAAGTWGPPVPHAPLLSMQADGTQDVVLLASGRSFGSGNDLHSGDAMWGLFSTIGLSNHDLGTHYATWAVNDLQTAVYDPWQIRYVKHSEVQAPMYAQAFLPKSAFCGQTATLSFDASELPWNRATDAPEDPVWYAIGAGTRLVSMRGGMQVRGSAPQTSNDNLTIDFRAIDSSSNTRIAHASFYVPDNHNGVVFFTSDDRVYQNINSPGSGSLSLWIEIDRGQPYARVGPKTVNTYYSHSNSMKTQRASYLADQNNPLERGGWHTVELFARVDDSAGSAAFASQDLPLIWFD